MRLTRRMRAMRPGPSDGRAQQPGMPMPIGSVDLPHGVPTPMKTHVHPYPTRFHGGIWTRPVFGFPWVRTPHYVIRPSELTGLGRAPIDPTFRPFRGLGNAGGWDVGTGVFRRPSYDGGGIFNEVSGMGALPANVGKFVAVAAVAFLGTAFLMTRK